MVKIFEVYSYNSGGSRPTHIPKQTTANNFLCKCANLGIKVVNATPEDGYYTIIIEGNKEQLYEIDCYLNSEYDGVPLHFFY
jgi:hypothetical protein